MSAASWAEVTALLEANVGPGRVAPAAALLVGRGREVVFEHSAGVAGPPGQERPVDAATVFDLASLTKPLVTAALTLDLVAQGRLELDTVVAEVLPGFAGGSADAMDAEAGDVGHCGGGAVAGRVQPVLAASDDERRRCVTVRDLLRHDAGIPAYRRYFEDFDPNLPSSVAEAASRRSRMFGLALAEPLERTPGSGSVYSDIGFLVLGHLVETVTGRRIDELATERLLAPLAILEDAAFVDLVAGASPDLASRTAATGRCEWRGRDIHAEVQDENAFAMGGIAPHAGLFATARAVHRLVAEWVDAAAGRGLVLDGALVRHAWNRVEAAAGAAESTWALGWDTPTPGASSAGSRIGADAVGHLGYTGTSVWVDPGRGVHVVLLTNRIACDRDSTAIRTLRPRLHDAVFAALG